MQLTFNRAGAAAVLVFDESEGGEPGRELIRTIIAISSPLNVHFPSVIFTDFRYPLEIGTCNRKKLAKVLICAVPQFTGSLTLRDEHKHSSNIQHWKSSHPDARIIDSRSIKEAMQAIANLKSECNDILVTGSFRLVAQVQIALRQDLA